MKNKLKEISFKKRDKEFFKNPVSKVVFFYILLFLVGGIILHLNFLINNGYHVSWTDSFFTSASAFATTGLTTFNILQVYNFGGWIVLIIFFNIGGMGIIVMNTLIFIIIGKKIGIKNRLLAQIDLNNPDNKNIVSMVKTIIVTFLSCEVLGAFLIFLKIGYMHYNFFERIMNSLFMAASATSGSGMYNTVSYMNDYFVLLILSLLMIFSFIGYPVIVDVVGYFKHKRSRCETIYHFSYFTKVVVKVNFITVVAFALIFLVSEHNNALDGYSVFQQIYYSFYNSISTKSVGLSVITNYSCLQPFTLFCSTIFMIIGGSPSSACGGIRVTTVYVIYSYTVSQFKGESKTVAGGSNIGQRTILKSFFVLFIFLLIAIIGFLFIVFFNPNVSAAKIWFDVISAITTTGFSVGAVNSIDQISIVILTLLMMIGRLGVANLISGIHNSKPKQPHVKYPEKELIV